MRILTKSQTVRAEQLGEERGLPLLRMMENAGSAAAKYIRDHYELAGKPIVVLAGRSGNAGDGFVAARKLFEHGFQVSVVLCQGAPTSQNATEMLNRIAVSDISVFDWQEDKILAENTLKNAQIVIDALFGHGFHPPMSDNMAAVLTMANELPALRIAFDLPSGTSCDSGVVEGVCFHAHTTLSFISLKPLHVLYPACEFCGDTVVLPIGLVPELLDEAGCHMQTVSDDFVHSALPNRHPNSHKGTYGKLLCAVSSVTMPGAGVLCAKAALRSGVGLVRMAIPKSAYPAISSQITEPVYAFLPENQSGTLHASAAEILINLCKDSSAMLIGCGLGLNDDTKSVVHTLLQSVKIPIVLDADGINAISTHIHSVTDANMILTPHPAEMARLTGLSVTDIESDRLNVSRRFSRETGAVLVLKGANTVVAAPDGSLYMVTQGNPGMATGGSGDVLAGIIASLAAQGLSPKNAAMCGVYLHANAGDAAAKRFSQAAMLPSDIISCLPEVFLAL